VVGFEFTVGRFWLNVEVSKTKKRMCGAGRDY
jgi:hypothetical protein